MKKQSIRDEFFKDKAKEEAKNQAAIAKVDQKLSKAVSKKQDTIGKKIAKEQTRQQKAADRVTKNQNKRGAGK